jgi:hypothetical protein
VHDVQVRAVMVHGGVEMQASSALDMVLQQLLPAWQDHVRQEAVRRAQDRLPGGWRGAGVGCCTAEHSCKCHRYCLTSTSAGGYALLQLV